MPSTFTLSAEARELASKLKDPSLFLETGYINGEHVRSSTGATFPVIDPATGKTIGNCPDMTTAELESAIAASVAAFDYWRHTTPNIRAEALQKWRALCIEHAESLAHLIVAENGKPWKEAMGEIAYSNSFLDWFAGEAMRNYGDFIPSPNPLSRNIVVKQPVGPVGCITPWNFSVGMCSKKAGAAIAAGCTIVIKPPPETPFSIIAFVELATRAGIPPGVINVVPTKTHTREFGILLCQSDAIKKISFTGSTPVGLHLNRLAANARLLKKVTMELGGNAPFIIFDDADLDLAIEGVIAGKFRANGQNCVSPNRIFVQSGVYDEVISRLKAKLSQYKVGPGLAKDTTHGPLIHTAARDKCIRLVKDMQAKGATIVLGGRIPEGLDPNGAYYEPTIVSGMTPEMDAWREELFGPIAALLKFDTELEALKGANNSEMGLACYIYTKDVARCWRLSEELSFGMCGINAGMVSAAELPFGGRNNSGVGTEGSKYGLDDYLEKKLLAFGNIDSRSLW